MTDLVPSDFTPQELAEIAERACKLSCAGNPFWRWAYQDLARAADVLHAYQVRLVAPTLEVVKQQLKAEALRVYPTRCQALRKLVEGS